jgi:hypothetical protein
VVGFATTGPGATRVYQEQDAIANSPLSAFSETNRPSTLIQHLTSPAAREPGVWRVLTAKCWSGVEGSIVNVSTNEPSRSEVVVGVVRRDSMSIPEAPTVTTWPPTDVRSIGSESGVDEHADMAMTTAMVPMGIPRIHETVRAAATC